MEAGIRHICEGVFAVIGFSCLAVETIEHFARPRRQRRAAIERRLSGVVAEEP